MTNRQYLTWQRWMDNQLNRPDITEYYLMQLTAQVGNLFAKNPVKISDYLLKFNTEPEVELSIEKRAELTKMAWAARLRVPYESMRDQEQKMREQLDD